MRTAHLITRAITLPNMSYYTPGVRVSRLEEAFLLGEHPEIVIPTSGHSKRPAGKMTVTFHHNGLVETELFIYAPRRAKV